MVKEALKKPKLSVLRGAGIATTVAPANVIVTG
jgi:hypothetical protein